MRPRLRLIIITSVLLAAACGSTEQPVAATATANTSSSTSSTTSTIADTDIPSSSGSITTTTTTTTTAPPRVPSIGDLRRTPVDVELLATVDNPVAVIVGPNGVDLWVAEQTGRVVRLPEGTGPAVDDVGVNLRGAVSTASEQGLLGIALAPDGSRLFTNHTNTAGTTIVSSWTVQGDGVDPDSATELLAVEQPASNHNGGHLLFGPDGHLWIGLGDGGRGGDPWGNGQNPDTLLGSMLRVDVSGDAIAIPADNPFVDGGGAPEVAVWGVRNPWRFSFDPATDDLWIADVGQNRFEEITVLRRGGTVLGANLGWNLVEGDESFLGGDAPADHAEPFVDYPQTGGRCSVTGGEVYRGSAIGALNGAYVFSDFCTGELLAVAAGGDNDIIALDAPAVAQPTSFGVDANGELLVLGKPGGVFRIVPG